MRTREEAWTLLMGIWDLPGGGPKVSMGRSVRATSNRDLAQTFPSSHAAASPSPAFLTASMTAPAPGATPQ